MNTLRFLGNITLKYTPIIKLRVMQSRELENFPKAVGTSHQFGEEIGFKKIKSAHHLMRTR